MFHSTSQLQAVANDFLYSDIELDSEERTRLENLDFTFEFDEESQVVITW